MTGFKTTATATGVPVKVGDRITAQDFFGRENCGVSGPVVAIDEGNMVIVTEADSLDGSRVGMKVWVPINMGVFDWDGRVTVDDDARWERATNNYFARAKKRQVKNFGKTTVTG